MNNDIGNMVIVIMSANDVSEIQVVISILKKVRFWEFCGEDLPDFCLLIIEGVLNTVKPLKQTEEWKSAGLTCQRC
nr:hypothetical protein 4 [bacterium]